jgi:hypothetical protein
MKAEQNLDVNSVLAGIDQIAEYGLKIREDIASPSPGVPTMGASILKTRDFCGLWRQIPRLRRNILLLLWRE